MTTFVNLLTAGDTLDFTTSVPDYLASAGWTLKYRLAPRGSGSAIDIVAAASGDDYVVQVAASTTGSWAAGFYAWAAYVEKSGERYTVGDGELQIRVASSTLAAGTDKRSHARKVLDAINAVIEGRASKDQQEYTIGSRSLKRTPIEDLLVLRDKYRQEVANEAAAESVAAGLGNPRRAGVRFNRI